MGELAKENYLRRSVVGQAYVYRILNVNNSNFSPQTVNELGLTISGENIVNIYEVLNQFITFIRSRKPN
jgi:hypothetical protein